ncbi:thiamine pyrophosphate-binding protein [Sphaerochaeta sp.]|uniref:thiamine pyrophosphate-binding protein n=1 Tax=Sphaerochaeta sp. TaxID=1972642 RepID=UPI002FCAA870
MITAAERLIKRMSELGVRYVFGIPSGSWLYYMEAMRKEGIEFILVSNEASAGFMADVYNRITGIPGICYATLGAGATNLTTGVGSAFLDRSSVISLTTEPSNPMIGRTYQMGIDQQMLFTPITKWTTRMSSGIIDQVFQKAVHIARTGVPGPVNIGLPEDLGDLTVQDIEEQMSFEAPYTETAPADAQLARLESRFKAAKRPVLAVGIGAVRAKVAELLVSVAERHSIPVVLTPMAKGMISEDNRLYAGVLFHALSDRVAQTYRQADLVIGVGYDPVEFNYESWMPEVPLAHLDLVPADIDRNTYPAVLDVIGSIKASLRFLDSLDPIKNEWDIEALVVRKNAMFKTFEPPKGKFGSRAALAILREVFPQDGIMTCGVGAHTHLIGQMWKTPAPGLQIMTNGWSSMGFGIPAAIAAKLSSPDKKVVCVTGDGGFLMMVGELSVAKRYNLAVVFVILKDKNLELIRVKQAKKNLPTYGTILDKQDTEETNAMFGVPILCAENCDDYRKALETAFEMGGPVVVEARIEAGDYDDLILRNHK